MAEHSRGTVLAWVVAAILATVAVLRLAGGDGERAAPPVKLDGAMAGAGSSGQAGPGGGAGATGQSGPAGGQSGSDAAGEGVYVHVAGAVRRPGLFRVPAGSRVAAALARAGGPGPKADLTLVNLAAPVQDGQQVVVPVAGAAPPAAAAAGAGAGAGAGVTGPKPSLATATVEQLEELDGIGPTLAQRIVEYRDAHGGFRSIGELQDVDGIGEKRFESLRDGLQP
jgi:competence protein ComEA